MPYLTGLQAAAVVTVLLGDFIEELTPPSNLRLSGGALSAGNRLWTVSWDEPSSWGDDRSGLEQRKYDTEVRELFLPNGQPAGGNWTSPRNDHTARSRQISVPDRSVWQMRVRADNMLGEESGWIVIRIHSRDRGFGPGWGRGFG